MRYLSLFLQGHTTPIVCIDLLHPDRQTLVDGIYYAEKFELAGYESNYKNIYNAKFKRTQPTSDPASSEQIAFWDVPKKLSAQEVITRIEGLQKRGKDKQARKMNPNSLANLKPAQPFTAETRPRKLRMLTDEQLDRAEELHANGCSWRKVGDLLGCNFQTVRSSLRRRVKELS